MFSNTLQIRKAFSLVEILWSVVLLSIIIVTITGVFTGILISSKKNEKFVVATNLAEKQIEYIRLMGWAEIPVPLELDGKSDKGIHMHDSVYFPPCPYPQPEYLRETVDGVVYYYKVTTSYVDDTGDKVKSILVTVYWDEGEAGGKNSITLEIYRAR